MRRVGSAMARLKGNLFLNTARLLQRSALQENFDYMRRIENGLAHLSSWLVFTKGVNQVRRAGSLIQWLVPRQKRVGVCAMA